MAARVNVGERLGEVRARVRAAAHRSGRDADDVTLIAVSKAHPIEAILDAYDAGHRDFGENRAQELAEILAPIYAARLGTTYTDAWRFLALLHDRPRRRGGRR